MKLKAILGVTVCCVLACSLITAQDGVVSGEQDAVSEAEALVKRLRRQRLAACNELVKRMDSARSHGGATTIDLIQAQELRFRAELEMASNGKELEVMRREAERLAEFEKRCSAQMAAGEGTSREMYLAKVKRLEVEVELAKLEIAFAKADQGQQQPQAAELRQVGDAKPSKNGWIYKVRHRSGNQKIEPILNEMAKQGWEFDQQLLEPMSQTTSSMVFNSSLVFRKPVQQ